MSIKTIRKKEESCVKPSDLRRQASFTDRSAATLPNNKKNLTRPRFLSSREGRKKEKPRMNEWTDAAVTFARSGKFPND